MWIEFQSITTWLQGFSPGIPVFSLLKIDYQSNPSGCGAVLRSHIWIVFMGRAPSRQQSSFGPTSLNCALCSSVYGLRYGVISLGQDTIKHMTVAFDHRCSYVVKRHLPLLYVFYVLYDCRVGIRYVRYLVHISFKLSNRASIFTSCGQVIRQTSQAIPKAMVISIWFGQRRSELLSEGDFVIAMSIRFLILVVNHSNSY